MEKVLTDIVWGRPGVKRFEDDVNALLSRGWKICHLNIEKRGFRFVCTCWVVKKGCCKKDASCPHDEKPANKG